MEHLRRFIRYDLIVKATYAPDVTDTFTTSFEVVPEPASIMLLLAGVPLFEETENVGYF